eukprot:3931974-Rhodomonas_salina.1
MPSRLSCTTQGTRCAQRYRDTCGAKLGQRAEGNLPSTAGSQVPTASSRWHTPTCRRASKPSPRTPSASVSRMTLPDRK